MARLTRDERCSILEQVVDKAFKPKQDDWKMRWQEFSNRVYREIYSEETRNRLSQVPVIFLTQSRSLCVAFDNEITHLSFPEARAVPRDCERGWNKAADNFPVTHPFVTEHRLLREEKEKLDEDERNTRNEVEAILESVTTHKRLIEVWPEIEPTVRPFMVKTKFLPTTELAALNDKLGLGEKKP